MPQPILHLTVEAVKEAGLKAYNEKRLSAQGPTPACRYRDESGRPCIIGAAIPDTLVAGLPKSAPVWHLRSFGITIDSEIVCYLQRLHDAWALSFSNPHQASVLLNEREIHAPSYYEAKLVTELNRP